MLGVISIDNAIASSHVNSASSASTDAQSLVLGNFRDTPGRKWAYDPLHQARRRDPISG